MIVWNSKLLFSVVLVLFGLTNYAQFLVTHHPEAVVYGQDITWDSRIQNLKADMFSPEADGVFPLVIMIPDAFFTSAKASAQAWNELAEEIASQGYVVASIQYRQGLNPDINTLLEDELIKAITRAVQDVYTAVNYFRMDAIRGSNAWSIDENRIFLFGYSTGGIAALHATRYFSTQGTLRRVDRLIESVGGWPNNAHKEALRESILGVVSLAGGVLDTLMYAELDRTPLLLLQAEKDSIIPAHGGQMRVSGLALGKMFGAETIYRQNKNRNKRVDLFTINGVGHEMDDFSAFADIVPETLEFFEQCLKAIPGGKRFARPSQTIITRTDRTVRNELIFRLPSNWNYPVNFTVINGNNEVVWQENDIRDEHTIPIEGWPVGTYIFKFTYDTDKLKVIRFKL